MSRRKRGPKRGGGKARDTAPPPSSPAEPTRPEASRRGLRRSRPISIVPEAPGAEGAAERRRRFFTRVGGEPDRGVEPTGPAGGEPPVRRWRWFRSSRDKRPATDMTDTEARAEAARTAAAELRGHLSRASSRPASRPSGSPPPGSGTGRRVTGSLPRAPRVTGPLTSVDDPAPAEDSPRAPDPARQAGDGSELPDHEDTPAVEGKWTEPAKATLPPPFGRGRAARTSSAPGLPRGRSTTAGAAASSTTPRARAAPATGQGAEPRASAGSAATDESVRAASTAARDERTASEVSERAAAGTTDGTAGSDTTDPIAAGSRDAGERAATSDAGERAATSDADNLAAAGVPGERAATSDAGERAATSDAGERAAARDADNLAAAGVPGERAATGDPPRSSKAIAATDGAASARGASTAPSAEPRAARGLAASADSLATTSTDPAIPASAGPAPDATAASPAPPRPPTAPGRQPRAASDAGRAERPRRARTDDGDRVPMHDDAAASGRARTSREILAPLARPEVSRSGRADTDGGRARRVDARDPAAPILPADEARSSRRARTSSLRRWGRPLTELLRPPAWQRHDLLVVLIAAAMFATGAVAQRRIATPSLQPTSQLGLHVSRPSGWLPPRRVGRPSGGLADGADVQPGRAGEAAAGSASSTVPYHIVIQSARDPFARLEIRVAERPTTGNLRSALVLERVSRHGEAHWAADSTDRTIGGRDWVRTQYRYAYKGRKTDAPRIATAVEYALVNGRLLYTVTIHGGEEAARQLEALLVPTLSIDANHPAAVAR